MSLMLKNARHISATTKDILYSQYDRKDEPNNHRETHAVCRPTDSIDITNSQRGSVSLCMCQC